MVGRMVTYLYTLDYTDTKLVTHGSGSVVETPWDSGSHVNVQMYMMGDKYGIWGLKKTAEAKFEKAITQNKGILDLLPVVATIYDSTPEQDRGLRDIAVRLAGMDLAALAKLPQFKEVVADVPEFACDIIQWASTNATNTALTFLTECRGCHEKTFGKVEKLRCMECRYLKDAPTSDWD